MLVLMKLEKNAAEPYIVDHNYQTVNSNNYQASDDWVTKWVVGIVGIMKGEVAAVLD